VASVATGPTPGTRVGKAYCGEGYYLAAAEAGEPPGHLVGPKRRMAGLAEASRWNGSPYNLWQARVAQKVGVDLASLCWPCFASRTQRLRAA
jgi:hypothetical protein